MNAQQMTLFSDTPALEPVDPALQAMIDADPSLDITSATMDALQDSAMWERRESGIYIRREPARFSGAWYAQRQQVTK